MRDSRAFEIVTRPNAKYRSLVRVAEPTVEPISVLELQSHIGIDPSFTDDNLYLAGLISSARYYVETVCDRTLVRSRWKMSLDFFPPWDIELPRPPYSPGEVTVTYVPSDGVYTPVLHTGYRIDPDSTPACLRPQWNSQWPTARGAENDVVVTWYAGYGPDGVSIPQPIKSAMMFLCAGWFANREAVVQGSLNPVPLAVSALLGTVNWGQYK